MVCGLGDHREATLTSLAEEWASLWLARFDVCRRQNARIPIWWWPRGTPVAGRPADASAGDAPTVTRHAVEQREVIWFLQALAPHCKRAAAKASVHLPVQFRTCLSPQSRGHNHHQLQWKAAIIQEGRGLTVPVLVVMCLRRWHKWWNRLSRLRRTKLLTCAEMSTETC